MASLHKKQGDISPAEAKKINENLRKNGIPTKVKILVGNLHNLIPESRHPQKFKKDVGL